MIKVITGILLFLFANNVYANVVVDINEIAGKEFYEVNLYLGDAASCKKTKKSQKCSYKKHDITVEFFKEKADWITIKDMGKTPFSNKALIALGLEESDPTTKNENMIKWENIPNFISISVFPDGQGDNNKISYVYIKTATK